MAASVRGKRRRRDHNVFLLTILYIMSSYLILKIDSLHTFSPDEIATSVKKSCLFLITEYADNDTSAVFHDLAGRTFGAETEVVFGHLSVQALTQSDHKRLNIKFDVDKSSLIVFERQKLDRTCLLKPPDARPNPIVYSGVIDTAVVAEFINVHCNTYRSHTGGFNVQGLHRQEILNNLFRVSGLTMGKMHDTFLKTRSPSEFHKIFKRDKSKNLNQASCDKNIKSCFVNKIINKDTVPEKNYHYDVNNNIKFEIPKCEKISMPLKEDFFHNYLKVSRPVIIKNVTNSWLGFKKWTNEFLKHKYGNNTVHVKLTPGGEFEGVEQAAIWEDYKSFKIPSEVKNKLLYPDLVVVRPAVLNIKFSDFMEIVENVSIGKMNNISAYLEYSSIPEHLPDLEEDIEPMPFMSGLMKREHLNIWLSDGDTLGKLHFDPFDNFLCQISGQKQVLLFEPHENEKLYEAHIPEAILSFNKSTQSFRRKTLLDSTSMVMSPVDILNPDFQRFPLFADTHPLNCTIDEGEVLFMPAFWWHEVQSYPNTKAGRNLAVNYWYEPFLMKEFPCPECRLDINPKYRHLL